MGHQKSSTTYLAHSRGVKVHLLLRVSIKNRVTLLYHFSCLQEKVTTKYRDMSNQKILTLVFRALTQIVQFY